MIIRATDKGGDLNFCCDLVMKNWGPVAAQRCEAQFVEQYNYTPYSPVFGIAEHEGVLVGFAAYQPSMKMKGSYDLIWLAVHDKHEARGIGKMLTEWRIAEIRKRDGQMIELVTQKPTYFSKFGFFKLHHLGNEWYLMLKLLTHKVDI